MMNNIKKVAAAQISPVFLNKKRTVEKACKAILEAGESGAELIVFPEAFISGYPDWVWLIPNSKGAALNELYAELVENAISVGDQSTEALCKAAKTAGINVIMGMHERNTESSNASLFNSLLFIDDQYEHGRSPKSHDRRNLIGPKIAGNPIVRIRRKMNIS